MLNLKPDWNEGLLITFGLAIGLILGGVFFSSAAYSNPPIPSSGYAKADHEEDAKSEGQNRKGDERGTQSAPFVIQIHQPPDEKAIATKTEREGQWYTGPDWWTAGFTGALFIATAGLWVFTALLWRSTNIVIADERQNSIRELRAYVLVDAIAIQEVAVGLSPKITITLQNYGKIPALKFKQVGMCGLEDYPIPAWPDRSATHSHTQTVGPGGKVLLQMGQKDALTEDDIAGIKNFKKAIYAFGEFSYDSGFGEIITEQFQAMLVGEMMLETESMANYLLPEKTRPKTWKEAMAIARKKAGLIV